MTCTLEENLQRAVDQYLQGNWLLLLFDYDGTLAEFADTPPHAVLPPATRVVLAMLAAQPRVRVGIISGRELDELKRMVGLPGLFYAGTSGLECDLSGEATTHPLVQHSLRLLADLGAGLEPCLHGFPGVWLERKRFGLTVHFRELEAAAVPHLLDRVEQELARWGDRIHVVTGAKAIEIIPNLGWTKGTAVELFLERLGPRPRLMICAGDEACDLEVLWEVGIHDGITIGVGQSSPTVAQYELPDAQAVEHLLENLCEALGCGAALEASKSRRE
ncbi:MAG: trehalose-phosphatase [Deltaproteobacteria bacterium]